MNVSEARQFALDYTGNFSFMLDMQAKVRRGESLTPNMVAAIARCAANTRSVVPVSQASQSNSFSQVVPDGTYTVVFNDDRNDYQTIRIKTVGRNSQQPAGTQRIAYLSGPMNERDFTAIAHLYGTRVKKFYDTHDSTMERYIDAIETVINANSDALGSMRYAYALASSRCARCGKTLTVPASIHRGLGPECANKD